MTKPKRRVLLVEPGDDLAAAIALALSPDFVVLRFADLNEAIRALRSFAPDLVLVNVTRENRVPETLPGVPLAVMTARTAREFSDPLGVGVLRLAFDASELCSFVERAVVKS